MNKTIEFRNKNPEIYKLIMDKYAPVFDPAAAIDLWKNNIQPPECEICHKRLVVKKKGNAKRCKFHINTDFTSKYTYERFIEQFTGTYDKWEGYKSLHDSVTVFCLEHGPYNQILSSIKKGHGCKKCYFKNKVGKYTIDEKLYLQEFNKIHNNKYDYSSVRFSGSEGKIKIKCPEHGYFYQTAIVHKNGHGCRKCAYRMTSDRQSSEEIKTQLRNAAIRNFVLGKYPRYNTKPELLFKNYLNENNIEYIQQYEVIDRNGGKWLYDFYLPFKKLLVEIDGEYWHTKDAQYNRDLIKNKLANESGHSLLRISNNNLNFNLIHLSQNEMTLHNKDIMEGRLNILKRNHNDRQK